jgi:hypothetical protein
VSIAEWFWIACGQVSLMATFALGMLVGMALMRKESQHDDGNSDTDEAAEKWRQWHHVERR